MSLRLVEPPGTNSRREGSGATTNAEATCSIRPIARCADRAEDDLEDRSNERDRGQAPLAPRPSETFAAKSDRQRGGNDGDRHEEEKNSWAVTPCATRGRCSARHRGVGRKRRPSCHAQSAEDSCTTTSTAADRPAS